MSSTAARAFSGYRRLFRARKTLFQGDIRALKESRFAIRAEFEKNKAASDPQYVEELLSMIDEAEDMMLHGIVQGRLNERGNYEVKVSAHHADTGAPLSTIEPITPETVDKMSGVNPKVEVTKSKPTGS